MPLHEKTKELLRRLKKKKNNELIDSIYKSPTITETKKPTTRNTFSQKKRKGKPCIPCNGTGKSSKGYECYPCCGTGREGERVKRLLP